MFEDVENAVESMSPAQIRAAKIVGWTVIAGTALVGFALGRASKKSPDCYCEVQD